MEALSDPETRWSAVEALGRIGDLRAAPALSQLLQDPAPEVRIEVIQALSHFQHPQMLDFVRNVAKSDPSRAVRARAFEITLEMAARQQTPLADAEQLKQQALAAKSAAGEPKLNALLVATRNNGASDFHLAVGQPPVIRLAADLVRAQGEPFTAEQTEALVRELWVDPEDRVLGLGVRRPDDSMEHLACRGVVLACSGFGGNAAMVRDWLPEMRDAVFAGHVGNDGSAIAWGRALGAQLADLGGYQGHGSWAVPHGVLVTWALMMEGGIQINALGKRFHDERVGYSEASVQVLAQQSGIAWNVLDDRLLALGRTFPDVVAAERAGAVRCAHDAAALAGIVGCDVATLAGTLRGTGLRAPYHAIKVTGALFHTQGGLAIDAGCRVQRADGTTMPNLLAAGGAARGVSGNAVWGYLSGNGLLSAVAGGFIAANTAEDWFR